MVRKITLLLLSVLVLTSYGFSQGGLGTLKGTVVDSESKEPIFNAVVSISKDGDIKGRAKTDFDGQFTIPSIEVGSYDVEVRNDA